MGSDELLPFDPQSSKGLTDMLMAELFTESLEEEFAASIIIHINEKSRKPLWLTALKKPP